jgi:hypothetical protein
LRTEFAHCLNGGARSLPQCRLIRHPAGAPVQWPECAERDGGGAAHRSFRRSGRHDSEAGQFGSYRRYSGHAASSSSLSIRRE